MGGDSAEREISLKSGEAIYKALKGQGYEIEKIVTSHQSPVTSQKTDTIRKKEIAEQIRKSGINFAFIALHGGFGEDGGMQLLLEELNIPYSGSGVLASRQAINKILSKEIFRRKKISIPEYEVFGNGFSKKSIDLIIEKLGFPLVVKPAEQGSSIGVSIVDSKEDLEEKIRFAFQYSKDVIVEKYVNGEEISIAILEERALVPILLIPQSRFYDYRAKYKTGMTKYLLPAPLSEQVSVCLQENALNAHLALGCSVFSRVDLMLDKQKQCFVLEVNTIPGFTEFSLVPKAAQAEGIGFGQLCQRIVELSINATRFPDTTPTNIGGYGAGTPHASR